MTPQKCSKIVGANIRAVRKEKNISANALAQAAGCSHGAITRTEEGTAIDVDRLAAVSQALEVPISRLFDGCDDFSGPGVTLTLDDGSQIELPLRGVQLLKQTINQIK